MTRKLMPKFYRFKLIDRSNIKHVKIIKFSPDSLMPYVARKICLEFNIETVEGIYIFFKNQPITSSNRLEQYNANLEDEDDFFAVYINPPKEFTTLDCNKYLIHLPK